jgi:polysaccharide export outer membrane protein
MVVLFLGSCNSYKNIPYFQNLSDSLYKKSDSLNLANYQDPLIQPRDLLQITLKTLDPTTSIVPSSATVTTTNTINSTTGQVGASDLTGYLVNGIGQIELPLIGKVKVAGLTTNQAKDTIQKLAAIYYKSPVVNVRLSNFTVTVLGEVNRPAQYIIPGEKISLLDVLGLAGDLTIYAKRTNVLLIREENGLKRFVRFNMNSSDLFTSPYFFLKPGDVVYVEPGKSKAAANDLAKTRNISIIAAVASVLIVIVSRLNF